MSVNTIPKETIDRMTSTALSGDLNAAFAVLNQSGLNEAQKAKIANILNESCSDMRQRIIAVVGEENIPSTTASSAQTCSSQATPSDQIQCISFPDAPTSPFGNTYPCTFEFGGKHYQNATACFLAQQYTDRPETMDLFTTLSPEEATALAEVTPLTKDRKISWENPHAEHINKDDVLMHVLRAKFGQNPDLKEQLRETGTAFLVCQGHELYLSDNFNGAGKNALGTSLMRLRAEYGGTGKVALPDSYVSATQDLQTRCQFIAIELNSDIVGLLFNGCLSQSGIKNVTALACLNKHWNSHSTDFWAKFDFTRVCPELTILDAKAQGVQCEDEPKISKLQLLKLVREISPNVEDNAGVTQLTMTKGTTLKQLIQIAKDLGIVVSPSWGQVLTEHGDVPVEQTYGILITNSVFLNSRNKDYDPHKILVEGQGCEMPTVQEYVALCVFTQKVFKKCLYGSSTLGRSSTTVCINKSMVVGGFAKSRLRVICNPDIDESFGAGGRRKY